MASSTDIKKLKEIIHSNFEISDDIADEVIAWVRQTYNPDDVFSATELESWAESNGYIKQSEQ